MPPIRVYADTSVYGGVFDAEFERSSRMFFEQAKQGRFLLVISALVEAELEPSPDAVRVHFDAIKRGLQVVDLTQEVLELQEAYLAADVVTSGSAEDALHVAYATFARCDLLVSWNFKHIVHKDKVPRYNAVNILRGFPTIGIYSPSEVIQYEKGL
jgi:hypothetical protein